MFKGSASFPTGQEVGLPKTVSMKPHKRNLKTSGDIFEFMFKPGVGISAFSSGHWTQCQNCRGPLVGEEIM